MPINKSKLEVTKENSASDSSEKELTYQVSGGLYRC